MIQLITTKHLVLRTWQETDCLPFAVINQDPLVMQYTTGVLDLNGTKRFITRIYDHFNRHGYGLYAVTLKCNQQLIGYTGIYHPEFKAHFMPCVSIGWRLATRFWGCGYATEAALAILNKAFERFQFDEVVAFSPINNASSRRVMAKIGMVYNPIDDFIYPDFLDIDHLSQHVLYRITRERWDQLLFKSTLKFYHGLIDT